MMRSNNQKRHWLTLFLGLYVRLFRTIVSFLVFLLGIGLFALLITFPLWFVATRHPLVYTTAVLSLIALYLIWKAIRRLSDTSREELKHFTQKIIELILLLVLLYFVAGFIASARVIPAIIAALPTLGMAGLLFSDTRVKTGRS
ncbi:hypothetical protein [Sediminispirochaeta smaragdinae]|uniref:Uncharacterized protein n=1 Tax=Sediminispirochaeta smaragdinae (strain DSM 11293 / JCM 15392 / SEBR 4228) TaxID=573413 RepID=E1R693_SEDSS|nr:hypothetical protein [Sediminispirochaeta smaragdinae]ADK80858.1 hypothetical protein Spirs_1731 [Sediminispirochaeta smaragdinae DSM 11293]